MSKRSWLETTSGRKLKQLREASELSRREVADVMTRRMQRPVSASDIQAHEDGMEPSQEALGTYLDLYRLGGDDYAELYPLTEAEDTRRNERADRKLAVEKRQREVDEGGWEPVRFRGDRFAEQLDEEVEQGVDPRRLPGGAQ